MEGLLGDLSTVKRKRTKRIKIQVSLSPEEIVSPSFTAGEFFHNPTEEEEGAAKGLILLSQGDQKFESNTSEKTTIGKRFTSRRFIEAATTTGGKVGYYGYECETCNKCFPSYQALGGHRTSHKRLKLSIRSVPTDDNKITVMNKDLIQPSMNSFPSQVALKTKIHKCLICSMEFNSGQALGGHMGRHRSASVPQPAKEKNSNGCSVDLNLPLPAMMMAI